MKKAIIGIRPLRELNARALRQIASGYVSNEKFVVTCRESERRVSINLRLVRLKKPYQKKFKYPATMIREYSLMLKAGYSFGAFEGERLVGLAIAEAQKWNRSLHLREFHIAEKRRGQGIGRRLIEHVAKRARQAGLRILVCETQNTNANAIRIYRRLGFRIEGIDLSFYSNHDYPNGEIAIFMKRRLA